MPAGLNALVIIISVFFYFSGLLFCESSINIKSFINKQKLEFMKKVLLVLAIGAFAACNGGSSASSAVDSAKAVVDSTAAKVDSTVKAVGDSAKSKMDSVAKKVDSVIKK